MPHSGYELARYAPARRAGPVARSAGGNEPVQACRSDRQRVATLVTARLQNGAAGASPHPGTKTMCFRTLSVIWLICTLHENLISRTGLVALPDLLEAVAIPRLGSLSSRADRGTKTICVGLWISARVTLLAGGGASKDPELSCG